MFIVNPSILVYNQIIKPRENNKISKINDKTDDLGISNELADFFETLGKATHNDIQEPVGEPSKSEDWITEEEIEHALKKLKNGKASPDALKNEMIKYGKEQSVQILKFYFNDIIMLV